MGDAINDATTLGSAQKVYLANRYRAVRRLGLGGMGEVWLAEDTQLGDRLVAIKMLPPILVRDSMARRRFKEEALVSLELAHTHIVPVRTFEENGDNPFLVVDYIDGQTLGDLLRARGGCGIPEADVIRYLAPIAAALDYAHSKGIVHRDVKPGNVMIARNGTPYLLDFGIACAVREVPARDTVDLLSGTLPYMSPEQLNREMPSAAQDTYSFAATVYACLTGKPPFSGDDVAQQILNGSPTPLKPSITCGPRVMAGLAKRAEERPALCADVLATEVVHAPSIPHGTVAVSLAFLAVAAACAILYVRSRDRALSVQTPIPRPEIELPKKAELRTEPEKGTNSLPAAIVPMLPSSPAASTSRIDRVVQAAIVKQESVCETATNVTFSFPGGERLVFVPGGTRGWFVGTTEVTQGQWQALMDGNPSRHAASSCHPVENVRLSECRNYSKRLSECFKREGWRFRLMTSDEWRGLCRRGGRAAGAYHWGDEVWDARGDVMANFKIEDVSVPGETQPVGSYAAHVRGIHDLHGNVAEWTEDGKICGGSYVNAAEDCRTETAVRTPEMSDGGYPHVGFRLVAERVSVVECR